jgi:pyruvate/2-oxoglutarate dehydrogenase complex dihydrolipoamide dehydrogenase (E3) component
VNDIQTDICVIGGGAGGLSVAAVASQMGANVVLCEKNKMGGDCLNYGCVPSKALIEASRIMHHTLRGDEFGIITKHCEVDFKKLHQHIHGSIAAIAPHDSIERFESLGVKVINDHAKFKDNKTVIASNTNISAKFFVIATGSNPTLPPIPGLNETNFLTNETIFNIDIRPQNLVVIGGGSIGCEIAQAYALLGIPVTLIEASQQILSFADDEARALLKSQFKSSGVRVFENRHVEEVCETKGQFTIKTTDEVFNASHLLVATGRTPNLKGLELDNANIKFSDKGIVVDKRGRTNQKRIFAIGDIASPYQFTHAASLHASIVLQNMLYRLPVKVSYNSFPYAVYTTPELVHVGLSQTELSLRKTHVLKSDFKDNDRALTSKNTSGFIKVWLDNKTRVLATTIVGESAAELITPWTIACQKKMKIKTLANFIAPYPTLSEISKRVAGSYYTPYLFSKTNQNLVKFLLRFL